MSGRKKAKRAAREAIEELGPPDPDAALLYLAGLPDAQRALMTDHVIFTLLGPDATRFTRPPWPGEVPTDATPPFAEEGYVAVPMMIVTRDRNALPGDFARSFNWTFSFNN